MFYFSNGIEPSPIEAKVTFNASLDTFEVTSINCKSKCSYGFGDSSFEIHSDDEITLVNNSPVITFDPTMGKDQTFTGSCFEMTPT